MNSAIDHHPALLQFLTQAIQTAPDRRISFAAYMDHVLYHAQFGYYTTQALKLGATGDFVTSSHLGADFGELLAVQLLEMWAVLGYPQPFTLVEMGAGQGLVARDILQFLRQQQPDCVRHLDYVIVERSPTLRAAQRHHLQDLIAAGVSVRWSTLADLGPITGCFFSNELVDAFPVHQVVATAGELQEVYVTVPDTPADPETPLAEVLGPLSTPRLSDYFARLGLDLGTAPYPDGYRTEVNLAALDWLETVAQRLQRGYVLTIDYGYPAHRYYSPVRNQGTLQCYYQHTHHSDPYWQIGQQDITAHVDFTTLEQWGDRCGLSRVGFVPQALFLMALGLGDRITALSEIDPAATGLGMQEILQRRDALHSLINPMGLGNFGVLVQAKGLTPAELQHPLTGLTSP